MGTVAVLVGLVLPNPLRIPQNNPAAQAEYAPVPGENEDPNQANFGETGQASSGGIGGPGGPLLEETPPPPLTEKAPVFVPSHKRCTGTPPRQTDDPLSPPCVPNFDQDNGGKTWAGVTDQEILIIYYNDFGVEGDLTQPYRSDEERAVPYPAYYYLNHVKTVKALLRYFQVHFQTYNRRVRMVGHASGSGLGTTPSARIVDMQIMADMDPFAVVTLIENAQAMAPLAKEFQIPIFGWNEDIPLAEYEDNAPYVWSFMPDQSTETVWSAEFLCRKLRGYPARFTTDPLLLGQPRKFGLIYQNPEDSQRGPFLSQLAGELISGVDRACGMRFDYIKSFKGNGDGQAASMMTEMKQKTITTVVCYCIAQQNELQVPKMQGAASGLSYYPEWYWDSTAAMDRTLWQQEYGNPKHQGFGSSYLWRQGPFETTYAYKAFLEQEPGQTPNLRFNFEIYHTFLSLFSGIQAAGPGLTPDAVQRGMFTFKSPDYKGEQWLGRAKQDPYVPTGGYGGGGPSRYTFVHTAQAWWYDPTGTPPGRSEPNGCIRVVEDGRRYFGPEWPRGDADLFNPDDPCTEDTRREV
jgi:hypothetical protein